MPAALAPARSAKTFAPNGELLGGPRAAVEAQAAGRPVIAYAGGGALETVIEGVTGTFFHEPTAASLAATLDGFDPARYHPDDTRANAARFAPDRFRAALGAAVADLGTRPREVGPDLTVP